MKNATMDLPKNVVLYNDRVGIHYIKQHAGGSYDFFHTNQFRLDHF
jgi:hypothetical protein